MNDNEKLIEEAAKAIYGTRDDAYDLDEWGQLDRVQQERYICDARAALAVFEKAHIPTDNEREALPTVGKQTLDKAIWWAVVQECQGQLGGDPHATTWARGGYRNDIPTLCDRCARLIETLKSLVALRPEPQGEPTDAEVEAAARAIAGPNHLDSFHLEKARAALRAAWDAR